MTPARWIIWWMPSGLVVDPAVAGVDPAPPETVVEGFVIQVPTAIDDPNGAGYLQDVLRHAANVARHGPDALGAALHGGDFGLTLEAVFQPDGSRKGVAP